ncbi:hypothetical protein JHK85_010648 [Glycine max]|nr:hypothetical protein JHK85_010648 [Glycine max]KAG5066635.1 hypothetical protein JHK86_010366 [Glycine max]
MPPSPPSSATPSSPPPSSGSFLRNPFVSSAFHRLYDTRLFLPFAHQLFLQTPPPHQNTLHKDLSSTNDFEVSLALDLLSQIATLDLAPDLTPVFVRKKAIAVVLRVFDKYPDMVRVCFKRLVENPESFDLGLCPPWVGERVPLALCESTREDAISRIDNFTNISNAFVSKFSSTDSCDLLICDEAHRLKNDQTITNRIGITGAILTKLDADSRGGAALTFREKRCMAPGQVDSESNNHRRVDFQLWGWWTNSLDLWCCFGLSHYGSSEFELMVKELLMSDSIVKASRTIRLLFLRTNIHLMLNSKMLIDAHGDQIAATSLLEASNLVGLKWQLSLTWIGPLWTLVGSYYFRQGVIGMEEFYGNILSWD